ncbi:HxlR family transcriptional regulator [Spiroplasma sabaudiense Ar-1343]|uniref:HxlR family transcriptional regulator n=1 Tax=Spiroplasma sabaudiense Ar-1343 TaxID=1276257 RepID=W6AJG0_9MOLU|nr:helix-turn-helix domain-containing protein [Spiroplasma sabaudiense]AHI53854.1 HxlR family transcriptional regulator [Spiroplasma sabaudiense Ar-1343]
MELLSGIDCPIELTLSIISNKWCVLILRDLFSGTKRFGELKKSLNDISPKVLTSNLKKLELNGLINRKVYPIVPPKVEYSLTKLGLTLRPVLDSLGKWGNDFKKMSSQEIGVSNKS